MTPIQFNTRHAERIEHDICPGFQAAITLPECSEFLSGIAVYVTQTLLIEHSPGAEQRLRQVAHLIAAAPELLSALRSTLSTLDFAIQKGVLECHGVREAALAAIAKAEGRS